MAAPVVPGEFCVCVCVYDCFCMVGEEGGEMKKKGKVNKFGR